MRCAHSTRAIAALAAATWQTVGGASAHHFRPKVLPFR